MRLAPFHLTRTLAAASHTHAARPLTPDPHTCRNFPHSLLDLQAEPRTCVRNGADPLSHLAICTLTSLSML